MYIVVTMFVIQNKTQKEFTKTHKFYCVNRTFGPRLDPKMDPKMDLGSLKMRVLPRF